MRMRTIMRHSMKQTKSNIYRENQGHEQDIKKAPDKHTERGNNTTDDNKKEKDTDNATERDR